MISKVFYNGIIDTGCNDDEKQHGLSRYRGKSIVWFDTSTNEKKSQKRTKGGSYINEEEKRITYEKEKCETLLSEINEELKSARDARKQGIQDLAPHYTGLG